jgi:threonine dehydratase
MQAALLGRTEVEVRPTIADGLAGNIEPGSVTIDLCARRLDDIVAVSDDEIMEAMRFLAREHGLVVEGSGAAAVAAIRAGRAPRGVAIVTGRNVTLETLATALLPAGAP